MRNSILVATASLALRVSADVYEGITYGNMFYLGPTTGGQYITKATYSMEVPSPPSDWVTANEAERWMSLWIGVQDNPSNVDVTKINFVQPLLNWGPDNEKWGCSAPNTQWCAAASTYTPSGQIGQPYVEVADNGVLDFEISLNPSTDMIDQKIYQSGKLISSESDSKGMRPAVFYSGNECYGGGCGTLDAYNYNNITLVFNKAVQNVGSLVTYTKATHTEWKTPDNGITWTIDSITIEEDNMTQ